MIDKNLVLVAARHTPTALKEPCVWQHQTAESVADLPQDERVFAGDLCVFAASDGTKTAFRYEHYWECEGEKKFDVYAPEVISENGTVVFTKDGEELEELSYGDTVTVTVTADSGYQVKSITINGEEIENGAEITVDGDILLVAEFKEAPAPSGTVLVPKNVYTAKEAEDETYGVIDFTFADGGEPLFPEIYMSYYNYKQILFEDGTDINKLKHTITVNDSTLTNQILKVSDSFGFCLGNESIFDSTSEDTGEDWFLLFGTELTLVTKHPGEISFGISYVFEAPSAE